jgi:hypothetical protein
MFSSKLLKILIQYTAFCAFDRFIVGGCKSKPCLILILCIAEFNLKASVFFTANFDNENTYWEWSGRIFNYLNSRQQEPLYAAFIIIPICILKIDLL